MKMEIEQNILLEKLKTYGVGRRKLDDDLFANEKPPPRLGIYDVDEESLCHDVIKTTCHVPGCKFTAESILEFENHYNASHRYSCSQCKKVLPSPHLLDLHIQEKHDSFFAVMAAKKPSFCCYIEECKDKFLNGDERLEHCVKVHKLPKDFRFGQKPKYPKVKQNKGKKKEQREEEMELDSQVKGKKFTFSNSRQKGFTKYTGKKFTKDDKEGTSQDVNMDVIVDDLKNSLPE
ncbi:protein lethal(2)k10201 isoform X2 [Hyposmocoma kahamanoa]|uniref:protein lethal(2)k10201 isoform X2 n=1 Tax=Hyposmocoma kahamanoa TaxID=1477025 RepID=UPI000E6D5D73|nr:protein lethal(2)k10201 isoform X2 [Hyposmocoma kahamanoa]